MSFRRRQAITAALTANAIRPVPGFGVGDPRLLLRLADRRARAAGAGADRRRRRGPQHRSAPRPRRARARRRQRRRPRLPGLAEPQGPRPRSRTRSSRASASTTSSSWTPRRPRPTSRRRGARWSTRSAPSAPPNPAIHVEKDIAFGDAGTRNFLDIYSPAERPDGGAPVLLQVHGGGWTIGKKDQQGIPLMQHLAAKGWVCVAINYRLAPRDPFPAQIVDVKKGIAWIRENIAAYGGDPDYIAITGGSAGGHLTALAATDAQRPRVAARLRGRRHLRPGGDPALRHLRHGRRDRAQERPADARPVPRAARLQEDVRTPTRRPSAPPARSCGSPPTPPTSSSCTAPTTASSASTRPGCSSTSCARTPSAPSCTPSSPAAQHAFDVFPSIRSAHIVRAIDRYLHWHWNQYRREQAPRELR